MNRSVPVAAVTRPSPAFLVRVLGDLGRDLTFAPERHRAARLGDAHGVPLASLVVERTERVSARETQGAVVLDTTHAKDGLLDLATAEREAQTGTGAQSAKKRVHPGDVLLSRLRPYLRQIALVPLRARGPSSSARVLVCSPEFHVLTAPDGAPGGLAYLIPFLLGPSAQAVLAAGQEGGHHPRVPHDTLFGLRVPDAIVATRLRETPRILKSLAAAHASLDAWRDVIASAT